MTFLRDFVPGPRLMGLYGENCNMSDITLNIFSRSRQRLALINGNIKLTCCQATFWAMEL